MSNCSECIICLDTKDTLISNNRCTCKYHYHEACWKKLDENKCILCNIKYNSKSFFVESPLIVRLETTQTAIQPVEVRIQIGAQQQGQQNKNDCPCICLSFICLILLVAILIGAFYFK
jgi:hypothetical protein